MSDARPILRTASISDSAVIAELHAESWRTAYANIMRADYLAGPIIDERLQAWELRFAQQANSMQVTICEHDSQPLGFVATFAPEGNEFGALLDNLHVRPNATGQGLGRMLLRASAEWVSTNFADSGFHLWVLKANKPAQQFYQKLGGVMTGENIELLPDGSWLPEYRYYWENPKWLAETSVTTSP